MSNFQNQDWQVVFTKAAFQMQIPFQVELVETVDAEFLEKSLVCTYMLTNLEVHKTHLGADAYFAKPMLTRILQQHGVAELGQTLQFTRPQVLPAGTSDSVMNVALRYAFVFKDSSFEEVAATETEEERIAREEEEEFQRLLEEEEAEKEAEAQRQREAQELAEKEAADKAEKDRLENEQKEREAEAQRLRDAEAAQQQEQQSNQEQTQDATGDDEFPEEER